jgi:hypothetical protein
LDVYYLLPVQDEGMEMIEIIRAITRPAVTIIFAAVIAQVVIDRLEVPDWFLIMANVVILEWWGERVVTHIKEKAVKSAESRS